MALPPTTASVLGSSSPSVSVTSSTPEATTTTAAPTTAAEDTLAPPPSITGPGATATVAPPPPATTGLPGLADVDPVCQEWAKFLGSVQILRIAQAFGGVDDHGLHRAEVIAASTIRRSIGAIEDNPSGTDSSERAQFAVFAAPYLARTDHAAEALTAAGVTAAQGEQIEQVWTEVLERWNPDDPAVQIPRLAPEIDLVVDNAATETGAKYPTFAADPTIATTQMNMPQTVARLHQQCPALSDVGLGDGT